MSTLHNTDKSKSIINKEPNFILFTIKTKNIHKTLFKLELKKTGDVYMYCKHAQFYRDSGTAARSDIEINQQRYSFHKSLNSTEGINFIKQTLGIKPSENINTHIVTPAIKENTGFVHILSRRAPDLSLDRYNSKIKDKYRTICIDSFDCDCSTLFYSIFIGSSNTTVQNKPAAENVYLFDLGDFKFMFKWAYLPLAAHSSGNLIHSMTIKSNTGNIIGQVPGLDMQSALAQSELHFQLLIKEYSETLHRQENLPINYVSDLFKITKFLKGGDILSPDRKALIERMTLNGSIYNYPCVAFRMNRQKN